MFWGLFDSSHRRLNSRWFVGGWNFPQNPLLFFNGNAKVFCDFRRRFCRRWSGWPNEVWIPVDQWHVIGFPDIQYAHYLTHFVKPCLLLTQWNRRFWKKAKEIVIQFRAYLEGTSGSTMVLLSISGPLHREGKADPSLLFLLVELSEVTVAASEKLCDFLSRHCSKIRLCSSAELPKVGSLLREFHSINEKLSSSLQYPFLNRKKNLFQYACRRSYFEFWNLGK